MIWRKQSGAVDSNEWDVVRLAVARRIQKHRKEPAETLIQSDGHARLAPLAPNAVDALAQANQGMPNIARVLLRAGRLNIFCSDSDAQRVGSLIRVLTPIRLRAIVARHFPSVNQGMCRFEKLASVRFLPASSLASSSLPTLPITSKQGRYGTSYHCYAPPLPPHLH